MVNKRILYFCFGLLGVLSFSLILKGFDNRNFQPAQGSLLCSASGVGINGLCWYLGALNESCTTVCSSRGGYNIATRDFVGSSGTELNCQLVLTALLAAGDVVTTETNALGCYYNISKAGRRRGTTATDPDLSDPNTSRACACNN